MSEQIITTRKACLKLLEQTYETQEETIKKQYRTIKEHEETIKELNSKLETLMSSMSQRLVIENQIRNENISLKEKINNMQKKAIDLLALTNDTSDIVQTDIFQTDIFQTDSTSSIVAVPNVSVPNFHCDICLQDKLVEEKYNLDCCSSGNICVSCFGKLLPNGTKICCPFCRTDIDETNNGGVEVVEEENDFEVWLESLLNEEDEDEAIECEEMEYEGQMYYVAPDSGDIFNEECEVIGKWNYEENIPILD